MGEISRFEWNGLKSQKFNGSRRHLDPIQHQQEALYIDNIRSKKHFGTKRNAHQDFSPANSNEPIRFSRKVFPNLATRETSPLPHSSSIKYINFKPLPKLSTGEKVHFSPRRPEYFTNKGSGKKIFKEKNMTSDTVYIVEDELQTKIRVEGLDKKRNNIGVHFLGDKPYAAPEFTAEFFKDLNGSIPGSNIKSRDTHKQIQQNYYQ